MSELGHSRPNWAVRTMSVLPPIATELPTSPVVRFVPTTEVVISLNHLVGTSDQGERHSEAERLGAFEIEEQLYFGG
jgi:hypothetical protein